MSTVDPKVPAAWRIHAEAYADWMMARLFARKDVYGGYTADGRQFTARGPVTRDLLVRHARGEITVGAHLIGADDRCLGVVLDYDAHDEGDDPEANWRHASHAAEVARGLGLEPLICDSDGKGGYHVRLFFKKPVPAAFAHWLGTRLAADWADHGMKLSPEVFPKQDGVTLDRPYGNWLRCPGKHHRRDHWTRIYDSESDRWLEGEAAVRRLIKVDGDSIQEMERACGAYRSEQAAREAAAREAAGGKPAPKPRRHRDGRPDEATVRAAVAALPAAWADDYGGERGNTAWLGVGMALHDWDTAAGLSLWKEFSATCPSKFDAAVCDEKWATFTQGAGLTIGTVFKEAERQGWRPPWERNGRARLGVAIAAGAAGPGPAPAEGERAEVEVNTERHRVLAEVLNLLPRDPGLYARGDSLAEVVCDPTERLRLTSRSTLEHVAGLPRVLPLSEDVLSCRLTSLAWFYRYKEDGDGWKKVAAEPPNWLVGAVATRHYWPGVRPLDAVASCPYPRADGSIVETPGYDPKTFTLYLPTMTFPAVPERPTQDDAKAAYARLVAPLRQFPFATEDDRAVWVAGLLTVVARPAIAGPVPGVAFNGNRAGCGKNLLVDAVACIATGRRSMPTTNYPANGEESKKVRVSLALSGVATVHLDNLPEGSVYGNAGLDSLLTSETINDRILGSHRTTGEVVVRLSTFLTGNNVAPGADSHRRWLVSNLLSHHEHPEARDDLEVPDLRGYLLEHRGELVRDALTILRAHALAGRKRGKWGPLGSFERWDAVVRGAVWFASGRDCVATMRGAADNAPDRQLKLALLEGWCELDAGRADGVTAGEAVRLAVENPIKYPTLHGALLQLGRDGKPSSPAAIGYRLRGMKSAIFDGKYFVEAGKAHQAVLWRVETIGPGGEDGEHREDVSADSRSPRAHVPAHAPPYTPAGAGTCAHARLLEPAETSSPSSPSSPREDAGGEGLGGGDDDRERIIL
jgi:putative DNA primase/helicase